MAINDIAQRLLEIKEAISVAEKEEASKRGRLEQILSQLKKEFKVDSIEDAEKLKKKINAEIINTTKKIEEGLKEIEDELEGC